MTGRQYFGSKNLAFQIGRHKKQDQELDMGTSPSTSRTSVYQILTECKQHKRMDLYLLCSLLFP